MRRSRAVLLLWTVLLALWGGHPLWAEDNVALIYDLIQDSNNRTFHDKSIYINYAQLYAIAFLGDWQQGGELGGYFFDRRKAAYSGYVRIREFDASYQLATEQPVSDGYVAKLQFRAVHISTPERPGDKRDLIVYGLGFDKYYGDYHYFSAIYYNDPRKSGRFSIVLSNTLAGPDRHLRLGLVPRSDGTVGYFANIRYKWLLLGYAFTREFDFAAFDRKVFTFAVTIPFDALEAGWRAFSKP